MCETFSPSFFNLQVQLCVLQLRLCNPIANHMTICVQLDKKAAFFLLLFCTLALQSIFIKRAKSEKSELHQLKLHSVSRTRAANISRCQLPQAVRGRVGERGRGSGNMRFRSLAKWRAANVTERKKEVRGAKGGRVCLCATHVSSCLPDDLAPGHGADASKQHAPHALTLHAPRTTRASNVRKIFLCICWL